jgi:hypothetical protein
VQGKARLSGDELVDCFTWPDASAQAAIDAQLT